MDGQAIELSLIIPVLNEAGCIVNNLETAVAGLQRLGRSFEIVVVNDGSTDDTAQCVQEAQRRYASILLISHLQRQGKGAAVRSGILAGRGRSLVFIDADLPCPLSQLEDFCLALENGAEIAIGRRPLVPAYRRWWRKLASPAFRLFVRAITGLPYADPQCGMKGFRHTVASSLFSHLKTVGYGFDVELLLLARQHGFHVKEIPVQWKDGGDSSLHLMKDPFVMMWEILRIWWRGRR